MTPNNDATGAIQRLKSYKPQVDRFVFGVGWLFLIGYIVLPWVGVDVSVRTAIIGIFLILTHHDV